MKVSERLIKRLKTELGLELLYVERVPRGRHQAACGQFAWIGKLKDRAGDVGSENTMLECVKAKHLTMYKPKEFSYTTNITAENPIEENN